MWLHLRRLVSERNSTVVVCVSLCLRLKQKELNNLKLDLVQVRTERVQ